MSEFRPDAWDEFVAGHPAATFFHRAAWRDVTRDAFGHTPHYLTVQRAGEIAAVLPLFEVRSRLFGHALIEEHRGGVALDEVGNGLRKATRPRLVASGVVSIRGVLH